MYDSVRLFFLILSNFIISTSLYSVVFVTANPTVGLWRVQGWTCDNFFSPVSDEVHQDGVAPTKK